MLHLLYILAFTIIAFLAISNLIRSLITVSMDSQRRYPSAAANARRARANTYYNAQTIHPELLDKNGRPISEPLLVMRSVTVEDARQQLDALYNSSPSQPKETDEEG
ncbi:DUF2973 domain-containing protein [Gloeothece verrucosa]|uniref:DUF2973 domain-containing protein n=1 Tax=Gloeothece verrucosa (strain PCC 7822) TaxID=497965 RepID=E0UHI0_GLOV7|nr:DUF2973 domain-containing protein [Gloeothece verrucosa]ADN12121.1 conserved hypothetical protein [Gloeothece verrucosa PCC 7822]